MFSNLGFVYIDNEMLMICILPVRVKEQSLLTVPPGVKNCGPSNTALVILVKMAS